MALLHLIRTSNVYVLPDHSPSVNNSKGQINCPKVTGILGHFFVVLFFSVPEINHLYQKCSYVSQNMFKCYS